MNGEMYVVKLITMSERARAVATGILGESLKEAQLRKLKEPDLVQELTRELRRPQGELRCPEIEVFERFGEQVREAFAQRTLSPFTRFHLAVLRDHSVPLGKLLRCGPDDALGNLFDPEKMRRTLQKADPEYAFDVLTQPDASILLSEILLPHNAGTIEQMYGLGQTGWGTIIQGEKWLRPEAKRNLKKYASNQANWLADDVTRVLATFLDNLELGSVEEDTGESPTYDLLALTYIRRRLHFLISQLREQAITRANEAVRADPSQSDLHNLPAWLEIYERGAITRALPYLIPEKRPLSTFIPGQNCVLLPYNKQPDLTRGFVIKKNRISKRAFRVSPPKFLERKEVGTFEVHCYIYNEESTQAVLRCKNLPLAMYKHAIEVIPKLTETDLSHVGNSIGQRLLNTSVFVPNRFLQMLNAGIKALGIVFVQCMVLCGPPLPIKMDIPGREDLSDQLPYKKLDLKKDIEFPWDVNAIADDLQKQYRRDRRRLEVVRDMVQEQSE